MEIALLIGIVSAVTKPLPKSGIYIVLGIIIGTLCAALFAFFVKAVSVSFMGEGDEILDSSIILLTAAAIIWTIVWMQDYGRKVKKNLTDLSAKIECGDKGSTVLVTVVAAAVFREGMEIILYVYSIASAKKIEDMDRYLLSLLLGSGAGFLFGTVIYWGLVNFAGKYIFKISSALLAFTAAGLAAEAAGILVSSGLVTSFSEPLWDSSFLISGSSFTGKCLKAIVGYDPKPEGLQLIFYLTALISPLLLIRAKAFLNDFRK